MWSTIASASIPRGATPAVWPLPVRRLSSLLFLFLLHTLLLLLLIARPSSASIDQWAVPPPQTRAFPKSTDTVSVTVGDNAVLGCKINYKGSYKVVWSFNSNTLTFNERRVTDDTRIYIRRSPHSKDVWDLGINQVRDSDEGDYYCIINTQPPQKRTVRLIIRVPPSITSIPLQQIEVIPEDSHMRVPCYAEGKPAPTIEWTREDANRKIFSVDDDKNKDLYVDGSHLMIASAKRWMEGTYVCTAANGIYPPARKTLTLTVQFRPVVRFINSRIGQQLGGLTMLQCKVESNPMGDVSWEFNGVPLEPRPQPCTTISTGQRICKEIYLSDSEPMKAQVDLTIRNVSSSDYGDYACVASSDLGTSRALAKLYKVIPNDFVAYMSRRYQNDAGRGRYQETPAPSVDKREPAETVVDRNTQKPHTAGNRRNGGPPLLRLSLLVMAGSAGFLHWLPCASRL